MNDTLQRTFMITPCRYGVVYELTRDNLTGLCVL
jgi:hypothetical protein